MTLRFPGIEHDFICDSKECINSLVVENPMAFRKILMDITSQLQGNDGKTVVFEDDKILAVDKYLELHSSFIPFSINQKNLINRIILRLYENSIDSEHYMRSAEFISKLEKYFMELSIDLVGDIEFTKLSFDSIIRSIGVQIVDEYDSLSEKLIDYFELVKEYERDKVFILLNLRSYLSYDEVGLLVDEILARNYQVLLLESSEYPLQKRERRYLVDHSLCEIC